MERATCALSVLARIACVFSDIDSSPVPSLRSRICLTSGHFESSANIIVIHFFAAGADFSPLKVSWCSGLSEQKQTQLDNRADFSRRGGLTTIGSAPETAITLAMAWSVPAQFPAVALYHSWRPHSFPSIARPPPRAVTRRHGSSGCRTGGPV